MSDFYFDSAATQQDAEAALQGLALDKSVTQPVFGVQGRGLDGLPKALFANRAMLALFGACNLEMLGKRLFSAGDPGAKRLSSLMHKESAPKAPRLERLRFYFGSTTHIFTFACVWVVRDNDQMPVFAATILDAPAELLQGACVAVPPVAIIPAVPDQVSQAGIAPDSARQAATGEGSEVAVLPRGTKAVRFLWHTDAQDRFTEITPPLAEIVGQASADLAGRTLKQVSGMLRFDPRGDLAQAFAKRETWSGVEVMWPIAGSPHAVPVGLGALPAFDRSRNFQGYHGFGVIYAHRIALAVNGEPISDAAPAARSNAGDEGFWTPAYDAENVVPLRPFGITAKNAPLNTSFPDPAIPEERTGTDPLPASDLSFSEQDAFHEIARTLAADDLAQFTENAMPVDAGGDGEHLISAAPRNPASVRETSQTALVSPPEPEKFTAAEAQLAFELDQMTRNARVIFSNLNAGVLVSRNEEPIFANRFLLDLLGYENLEAFQKCGGIPYLIARPAAFGSTTVELTARDGHLVPMIASEQCVEWDHQPSTLLILQPAGRSEFHAAKDATLSHYESESRELNAILDTATDGVAVLDAMGRIITLNRSGEALFGYDQNEVAGEPFSLLFDAESRAIAEDYLEGLKTNSVKSLLNDGREIVGRARQGGSIPIFMTLGRVSSSHAEDKDLKFCALLRDMTHWKKVEQELDDARKGAERASALKSDFLAKVSHEIRTPLNAILGFAEVIMDERFGPIGNERYKDYLKDIHMSGAHVMSLVNDLLDLSKIEAGKLELDFHEVDANRIISECVALMQPQANRERVIMRMSLAANLPHVSADERSLRQIILNLLSNAVKFNEPGGQVIVATASSGAGHAIIRIRDTGIGMSEEDIETALEPFRQVATARHTTGTGLGLPLTKALVEANHAFFSIKSKKQEGTLVEVTFPVMRVSA